MKNNNFEYGMKSRPFSIGCQPNGAVDVKESNKAHTGFYDIVVYDRELSAEEISTFELVSLEETMA